MYNAWLPLSTLSLVFIILYPIIDVSTHNGVKHPPKISLSFPPIDFTKCGKSYNCFRKPTDCSSVTSCNAFAMFQYNKEKQIVLIQIATKHAYVAFGQNTRPNAYMVKIRGQYCFKDKPIKFGSFHGNDLTSNSMPTWVAEVEGVKLVESLVDKDNVLICKYTRIVTPTSVNEKYLYDFNNTLYTLMAFGDLISGSKPTYHDNNYIVSSKKINYLSKTTSDIEAAKNELQYGYKIHGVLMVIAYVFLATAGIMTSRYLKGVTSEIKVRGMAIWFPLHVSIVLVCLAFVVSGFVVVMVEHGGWSHFAGKHHYTGLAAVITFLVQPLMALARPPPEHKWRFIFNHTHRFVGLASWLLGAFAIAFAFGMLDQSCNVQIAFIVITIVLCTVVSILLMNTRKSDEPDDAVKEKRLLLIFLPILLIFAVAITIYEAVVIFSL